MKEAAYKALYPTTRPTWKELSYVGLNEGIKPSLRYTPVGERSSIGVIHVSVSHDGEYVFSQVLVESEWWLVYGLLDTFDTVSRFHPRLNLSTILDLLDWLFWPPTGSPGYRGICEASFGLLYLQPEITTLGSGGVLES